MPFFNVLVTFFQWITRSLIEMVGHYSGPAPVGCRPGGTGRLHWPVLSEGCGHDGWDHLLSYYSGLRSVTRVAFIFYLITLGGYVSARLYNSLGGEKWAWNIFVTAIAFMGPAFGIWMILNTVAIA